MRTQNLHSLLSSDESDAQPTNTYPASWISFQLRSTDLPHYISSFLSIDMAPFYPKKWYIVPHDEYPATTTLPSGQLISSVDEISHSRNRKTLVAPQPSEIKSTLQTSSKFEIFKKHALHSSLKVSATGAPASEEAGGGGEGNDKVTMDIDVVQTQIFSPGDDYAKGNFSASRKETEMMNYLKKKKLGLKVPLGSKNVLMITARKIGKAMTLHRDEVPDFDATAKIGLDIPPGVNVEASPDAEWKKGLKLGGFTEEPGFLQFRSGRSSIMRIQRKQSRQSNS
jgi:hypothetical protein